MPRGSREKMGCEYLFKFVITFFLVEQNGHHYPQHFLGHHF